jgi:inner membrane protein
MPHTQEQYMRTTPCIDGYYLDLNRYVLSAGRSAPPFPCARPPYLRGVLGGLWLGVVFCAAMSAAAEPARAERGFAAGVSPVPAPAWQQFYPSRGPFERPPAGNGERDRGPRPPASLSDGDRRLRASPHDRAPCAMVTTAGPETVGSAPAAPSRSLPAPVRASVSALSGAGSPSWWRVPAAPRMESSPVAARLWLIAGAILLLAMVVSPDDAAILGFLALSGFIVGATAVLVDLTWPFQVSIFVTVAVMLAMLRALGRARGSGRGNCAAQIGGRGPDALVGREFRLEKPIEGGDGVLTTGGTAWRIAAGRDCAAGGRVRVLRTDGTLLIVDPVEC